MGTHHNPDSEAIPDSETAMTLREMSKTLSYILKHNRDNFALWSNLYDIEQAVNLTLQGRSFVLIPVGE